MRNTDYTFEVLVPAKTSLFSDQTAGQDNGNDDAGNVGGTNHAAAGTLSQNQGTNWEAAYKTLQRNHNDLQAKFATMQGQNETLTAQLATRASEISAAQTQLQAEQANVQTLTSQVTSLEGEKGNLSAQLERQNLIMGEFPQLATFEAQGLLPQAEGEDAMRDTFTKFAATIDGLKSSAIETLMEGASPEPVGGVSDGDGKAVTLTTDQMWDKVVKLSGGNDKAAYDQAYNEYLEALGQEQEISGHME